MERIASFCIDHLKLERGIYVSRKDYVGKEVLTSFDLRNNPEWKDKIIYWGPMGCMTGNYLILAGDYTSKDIAPLITELFEYIANFEGDIPGASALECGNFYNNNLPMAKYEAKKYLETLHHLTDKNLNYPK